MSAFLHHFTHHPRVGAMVEAIALMTPDMNVADRRMLIDAMEGIPLAERRRIVAYAQQSIRPEDRATALNGIVQMTSNERNALIERGMSDEDPTTSVDVYEVELTLRPVREAVPRERSFPVSGSLENEIEEHYPQLWSGILTVGPRERVEIIEAIGRLPQEERGQILALAGGLIPTRDTRLRIGPEIDPPLITGIGSIIDRIVQIPFEHREAVARLAQEVIDEGMSALRREWIIDSIQEIPVGEQRGVIDAVLLLIEGRQSTCDGIEDLIDIVAQIPVEERGELIVMARSLLTPVMDGYARASIVDAVADLSSIDRSERSNIIELAAGLIRVRMGEENYRLLLSTIREIVPDQRAAVVARTAEIIQLCSRRVHKVIILLAIAALSHLERDDIVGHVRNWVDQTQTTLSITTMLEALSRQPREERGAYVEGIRMRDRLLRLSDEPSESTAHGEALRGSAVHEVALESGYC